MKEAGPVAKSKGRRWVRWVLPLVLLFVAIQFLPVERTNPPAQWELMAPPEVEAILERACYDCHSHRTDWPWYSRVAPLSWWVVEHVNDGRGDLNFSQWPRLDWELQKLAYQDIHEQITKGEMPLQSYVLMHSSARLTDADRKILLDWAGTFLSFED